MTELLYRWPDKSRVAGPGRVIPKTKFYENTSISSALKAKFIAEVRRTIWKFTLAENTVHLEPTREVPEIQIFTIEVKEEELSLGVLAAIDRAVPKPIIFELQRDHENGPQVRMTAAYKPVGRSAPKPTDYVSTDWTNADRARAPLPPALDLSRLYDQILLPLLPIAPRENETIEVALARTEEIHRLEKDISRLERRKRNERQFNRKFEIRRELKTKQAKLVALTDAK